MTKISVILLVAGLLTALPVTPAHADLVFDDGADNTFDSFSAFPIIVQNSTTGDPTHLDVLAGADLDDPGGPNGLNGDTAMEVRGSSTADVFGGLFRQDLDAEDNSVVNIYGGTFQDDLFAYDNSSLSMYGGTLADDIEIYDNAVVNLFGGTYGEDIEAFDAASVQIFGGDLDAELYTDGASTITLYGEGFQVDGVDVDFGAIDGTTFGTLSGILSDGSDFEVSFLRARRRVNGVRSLGTIDLVFQSSSVAAVPEPASLALLGALGSVVALRRRRDIIN